MFKPLPGVGYWSDLTQEASTSEQWCYYMYIYVGHTCIRVPQVSFQAVDDGTQLHITGVQLSTDIYFFSQDIRVNPEVRHVQALKCLPSCAV